jgi:hypothetical protein
MTEEIWKDIVGYENLYTISNLGNIKNKKGKLLVKSSTVRGYLQITLNNKKPKTYLVHRLLMAAFYGPSNLQVDHINGIRFDNRIENLEYVTGEENINRYLLKTKASNISGVVSGVTYEKEKNKWAVKVRINGKLKRFGRFKNYDEAVIKRMSII